MLPLPGFRSSFRQVGPLPSRIALSSAEPPGPQPSSMARLTSRGPRYPSHAGCRSQAHLSATRRRADSSGISESSALLRATFRSSLSPPGSAQELVICWPLRHQLCRSHRQCPNITRISGPLHQDDGADRDPSPPERPAARVRGPKAGRLVRLLVDVALRTA